MLGIWFQLPPQEHIPRELSRNSDIGEVREVSEHLSLEELRELTAHCTGRRQQLTGPACSWDRIMQENPSGYWQHSECLASQELNHF